MSKVDVITAPVLAKFAHLDEHESFDGISTGKYAVTLIIKPEDSRELQEAIKKAGSGIGNNPLQEIPGDAKYDAGMFKLKAKSKFSVKVTDKSGVDVAKSSVENATVQAAITFADYTAGANRGTTAYLSAIRVLESGGGNVDFGDIPEEFNDPLPF